MAASDDFPRGIDLSIAFLAAGTPEISLPAVNGISWCITGANTNIYNTVNTAAFACLILIVTTGGSTLVYGSVAIPAADTGDSNSGATAEWSWTGKILAPPDQGVSIYYNGDTLAGQQGTLELEAYAI